MKFVTLRNVHKMSYVLTASTLEETSPGSSPNVVLNALSPVQMLNAVLQSGHELAALDCLGPPDLHRLIISNVIIIIIIGLPDRILTVADSREEFYVICDQCKEYLVDGDDSTNNVWPSFLAYFLTKGQRSVFGNDREAFYSILNALDLKFITNHKVALQATVRLAPDEGFKSSL